MSSPAQTIEKMETKLFELISNAQRNGLSPSMAISAGVKPFLERLVSLENPREPPEPGANLMCLICAHEKPWGVFSSKTGAAVCIECRDKARA